MDSVKTCAVCRKEWVLPGIRLAVKDPCCCDLRAQRDAALDRERRIRSWATDTGGYYGHSEHQQQVVDRNLAAVLAESRKENP